MKTKTTTILKCQALTASRVHEAMDKNIAYLSGTRRGGTCPRKAEEVMQAVIAGYRYIRHSCIACGTSNQVYQDYMVHDALWEEHVGYGNVCVCAPCLEAAMGRELTKGDLKPDKGGNPLPCNEYFLKKLSGLEPPLISDNEEERAKIQRESETFYSNILARAKSEMTERQLRALEEVEQGNGNAYGVTKDPVKGVQKRAVQQNKRRGYSTGKRAKK